MPVPLLKTPRFGLLWGLSLALGGCANDRESLICPQPFIIRELSKQYQVDDNPGKIPDSLSTRTFLERVSDYKCSLKKGVFASEVSLWVSAERKTPSPNTEAIPVTYFMSILSPEGDVLSKKEQTVILSFSGTKQLYTKQHVVLEAAPLILNKGENPEKLRLRVGLQFSPEAWKIHKKSLADQERGFYGALSSPDSGKD